MLTLSVGDSPLANITSRKHSLKFPAREWQGLTAPKLQTPGPFSFLKISSRATACIAERLSEGVHGEGDEENVRSRLLSKPIRGILEGI